MTDFVSENKCFLNEKEKTLCKRGYYLVRASDRSWKKKSNFAGFLGTKSRKNRPISREFSGQTIGKKTADLVIFRANFARNRSVLR